MQSFNRNRFNLAKSADFQPCRLTDTVLRAVQAATLAAGLVMLK